MIENTVKNRIDQKVIGNHANNCSFFYRIIAASKYWILILWKLLKIHQKSKCTCNITIYWIGICIKCYLISTAFIFHFTIRYNALNVNQIIVDTQHKIKCKLQIKCTYFGCMCASTRLICFPYITFLLGIHWLCFMFLILSPFYRHFFVCFVFILSVCFDANALYVFHVLHLSRFSTLNSTSATIHSTSSFVNFVDQLDMRS